MIFRLAIKISSKSWTGMDEEDEQNSSIPEVEGGMISEITIAVRYFSLRKEVTAALCV